MMSALVLAAGEGRRLGEPKALAMLAGQSLLERVVRILAQSTVDEIVVTCGARGDEVAHVARSLGDALDDGAFRPSDWSERLAGAMACFRPEGTAGGIAAFIGYSPYCVPCTIDGVKCVIVSEALRDVELMAWDFVTNFARDNRLQVVDVPTVPDEAPAA